MAHSFRAKPVGWRGESHRHYLAAKGIKTKFMAWKNDYEGQNFVTVREVPISFLMNLRGIYNIRNGEFIFPQYTNDKPLKEEILAQKRAELEKQGVGPGHWSYEMVHASTEEVVEAKAKKKQKELEEQGFIVQPWAVRRKNDGFEPTVLISYRLSPNAFKERSADVMQQASFKPYNYVEDLKDAILSETEEVPMVSVSEGDQRKGHIGEGRHRIIAAKEAGFEKIPVIFEKRKPTSTYNPKFDNFNIPNDPAYAEEVEQ